MKIKAVFLIACVTAVAIPVAVWPQAVTVQAEGFTDSHDIAYEVIRSMGSYIQGLDYPDEWTTYAMSVGSYGEYSVQLRARGDLNETVKLRVILTATGSGETQTRELEYVGTGMT